MDTGTSETQVSFTNKFTFKGRIGGNYRAKISSVGRNGTQSPVFETDEFYISDNVMLLEGAKNAFNTIGAGPVTEDFFVKQGHKVFAWASFVLDKSIAIDDVNNVASVTLTITDRDKPITDESATVIETIALYKASETTTDLDDTALGGITRPNAPKLREGTFGTEFAVMFSPFTLDDDLSNVVYEFHLTVTGRDQEDDIANLALSLYSAHEGEGDEIPGDPHESEPPITFPHLKSVWLDNSQKNSFALRNALDNHSGKRGEYLGPGIVETPFRTFGDGSVFTIAYWAKDGHNTGTAASPNINWFKDENVSSLPGGTGFRAGGYHMVIHNAGRDNGWAATPTRNSVRVNMNWSYIAPQTTSPRRTYRIDLADKDGTTGSWIGREPGAGARPGNSGPWGPNRITPIDTTHEDYAGTNGPGEWQFYTLFFDTVTGLSVYIDGFKRDFFTNSSDNGLIFDTTNRLEIIFGPEEAYRTIASGGTTYNTWRGPMDPNNPPPIAAAGSGIHPDDGTNLSWDYTPSNAADVVHHQAAIWDFSPGPISGDVGMLAMHQYLFNNNDGTEIDWREDGGPEQASGLPAYFFSAAMKHHWLFGNVNATQYMGRDTGYTTTGTGVAATENGRADLSLTASTDPEENENPVGGLAEPGGISVGADRAEAKVNGISGLATRDFRYICTASDNRTIVGDQTDRIVQSKSNIVDDYPSLDELWAYPKTGDR
jgi:hypothetical protein